jgi:lambda repressor-like predicted transcriptional regulator
VESRTTTKPQSTIKSAKTTKSRSITKSITKSKTIIASAYNLQPQSISNWEIFKDNVNKMVLDDSWPNYEKLKFVKYRGSEEADVQNVLQTNVFQVLDILLFSKEVFRCKFAIHLQRNSDFLLEADNKVFFLLS